MVVQWTPDPKVAGSIPVALTFFASYPFIGMEEVVLWGEEVLDLTPEVEGQESLGLVPNYSLDLADVLEQVMEVDVLEQVMDVLEQVIALVMVADVLEQVIQLTVAFGGSEHQMVLVLAETMDAKRPLDTPNERWV